MFRILDKHLYYDFLYLQSFISRLVQARRDVCLGSHTVYPSLPARRFGRIRMTGRPPALFANSLAGAGYSPCKVRLVSLFDAGLIPS